MSDVEIVSPPKRKRQTKKQKARQVIEVREARAKHFSANSSPIDLINIDPSSSSSTKDDDNSSNQGRNNSSSRDGRRKSRFSANDDHNQDPSFALAQSMQETERQEQEEKDRLLAEELSASIINSSSSSRARGRGRGNTGRNSRSRAPFRETTGFRLDGYIIAPPRTRGERLAARSNRRDGEHWFHSILAAAQRNVGLDNFGMEAPGFVGGGMQGHMLDMPGVDPAMAALIRRDINENDYETLLQLDETAKPDQGAREEQINRLPTFSFTTQKSEGTSGNVGSSNGKVGDNKIVVDLLGDSPLVSEARKTLSAASNRYEKDEVIVLDDEEEEEEEEEERNTKRKKSHKDFVPTTSSGSGNSSRSRSGEDGTDEEMKCTICLCPYKEGEQLMRLPCLHAFHTECITAWLKVKSCCPVDQTDITHESPLPL